MKQLTAGDGKVFKRGDWIKHWLNCETVSGWWTRYAHCLEHAIVLVFVRLAQIAHKFSNMLFLSLSTGRKKLPSRGAFAFKCWTESKGAWQPWLTANPHDGAVHRNTIIQNAETLHICIKNKIKTTVLFIFLPSIWTLPTTKRRTRCMHSIQFRLPSNNKKASAFKKND